MADSELKQPDQVPMTDPSASLSGKTAAQEMKQGDDPLSSSQRTGSPEGDEFDSARSSLPLRQRSEVLSHRPEPEEATTVGGGDGGRLAAEQSQGGGKGTQVSPSGGEVKTHTIMNGELIWTLYLLHIMHQGRYELYVVSIWDII